MMLLHNHCHTAGMFMFKGRTANFSVGQLVAFLCFVLFLSVPNENKFTETFMPTWQSRLEPFQRHSHSANGVFREITFCTEL